MDAGHLIAINVVLLYAILGPLVLLAIYVLFDTLAKRRDKGRKNTSASRGKDPAVWSERDIDAFMSRD